MPGPPTLWRLVESEGATIMRESTFHTPLRIATGRSRGEWATLLDSKAVKE